MKQFWGLVRKLEFDLGSKSVSHSEYKVCRTDSERSVSQETSCTEKSHESGIIVNFKNFSVIAE